VPAVVTRFVARAALQVSAAMPHVCSASAHDARAASHAGVPSAEPAATHASVSLAHPCVAALQAAAPAAHASGVERGGGPEPGGIGATKTRSTTSALSYDPRSGAAPASGAQLTALAKVSGPATGITCARRGRGCRPRRCRSR
jgi:hypothetical protein